MRSSPNRRIVDGATTFGAGLCEDGDGNKASTEQKVKEKAEKSEEGDAAEEAGKDDGKTSVDDSSSCHTLNCLLPFWNMKVVIR